MTRKLKIAAFASVLAGVASAPGVALAQNNWQPSVFKVHDPDPNDLARVNGEGRLRKTDEEFTNEQSVVKFFGDNRHALYVEMRTGALDDGTTPVHRMQAACSPLELIQNADGTVALRKLPGERFVTDNDGNEYRNANKPELMPINGGKNMLVMFNYQPAGTNDTRRYAKVLDQSCNEVPVYNRNGELRKQVLIMAKNNDDCDMHQSGEGPCDIASDSGGVTHLTCWAGCNGNGEDDGWINDITVTCENDADGLATRCTIRKNFDLSLCQREERSRGRCTVSDEDPNTAICTWTEGNNQPQRDGTWIAAVDISPDGEQGENADSRLLWKEQFDGRKDMGNYRTYSVRANQARVLIPNADGSLTKSNMLFMYTGDLQGENRDNRKGGTYRAQQFAILKATREGLEYVTPRQDLSDLLLGIDATHTSVCPIVVGEGQSAMPAMTILQGSHNGGGVQEPVVKILAYNMADRAFQDAGTHRLGGSYDRHLYSNYLGNNPGNQGRNFAGCTLLKNPFAGQNGNNVSYYLVHSMTGKSPEYVDNAAMKPSSYVSLLPVATLPPPPAPPAPQDPPPPADPQDPPATGGTGANTGMPQVEDQPDNGAAQAPAMGCAAAPGASGPAGALFLIVAMGALHIVRRRRS